MILWQRKYDIMIELVLANDMAATHVFYWLCGWVSESRRHEDIQKRLDYFVWRMCGVNFLTCQKLPRAIQLKLHFA